MLKREEIVYISNDWCIENKTCSHHIAEELAENNRILYVEAPGQRAPRASKRDIKKIFTKINRSFRRPEEIRKNIYLYSPLILPFHKYALIRFINKFLLGIYLRKAQRNVRFIDPIIWIFMPHFYSAAYTLKGKGVVYYCTDDYSAFPSVESETIAMMENALMKRADVVFTVSEMQYDRKRRLHPNTFLMIHGVDYEHFRLSSESNLEVPSDIESVPRPIVGFFGLIEEWIDLELIGYLAAANKGISFVLIGRVAQDVSFLKDIENVYFLGQKDYSILPHYMKTFDVCMLPYKMNEQVINSNPKKLREYLAGGKPVVSFRVKEVERYNNLVYIADSREEFNQCILSALQNDSSKNAEARMSAMKEESWKTRVDEISRIIRKHLLGDSD